MVLASLWSTNAWCTHTLIIPAETPQVNLDSFLLLGAGNMSKEEAFALFRHNKRATIPAFSITPHPDSAYWLYTSISNQSTQEDALLLLSFQNITHGMVYEVRPGSGESLRRIGIFERRSRQDGFLAVGPKYNVVPVVLSREAPTELLIQVRNEKLGLAPSFEATLQLDTAAYRRQENINNLGLGVFSGALLLLISLALILFGVTRDRSFIYYSAYLLVLLVWSGFSYGFLRNWAIQQFPIAPKYVFLLRSLVIFLPTLYLFFIWSFGRLRQHFPRWHPFVMGLGVLSIFLFFADWGILLSTNFNFVKSNSIASTNLLLVLITVILLLPKLWRKRKNKDIRLILAAIVVLLLSGIISGTRLVLNNFRSLNVYEVMVAQIADIGIFSAAIVARYREYLKVTAENTVIKGLLDEKETLLREIHHRVKNNLQVVSSLLKLQSHHTSDRIAMEALQESQDRVTSMSLIHQFLYQQENLTAIAMPGYLRQLTDNLLRTYQLRPDQIDLKLQVDELDLDVELVIPIGLVVNELVSNTLKYAFPDGRSGKLVIQLIQRKKHLLLRVADDGVGLPAGFIPEDSDTFGFNLIQAFAQKLNATLTIDGPPGTDISLRFLAEAQ